MTITEKCEDNKKFTEKLQ